MKGKVISAIIVLLAIVGLVWVFFFQPYVSQKTGGEYKNITDLSSSYNADAEVANALERMKKSPEQATVITDAISSQRQIALTFDGLADRSVVQKILDLLEKHKAKATFFVDGMQTAKDPQTVVNIKKAGHKVENYSLMGISKMENLPVEELVKDFCQSQKIIKVTTDNGPNLLKCNDTKYMDRVLQTAKACGFRSVVKNEAFVTAKNLNTVQAANSFVSKIRAGSIVSVKLSPNTDPIFIERGKIDLKPAVDKQPGLKTLPQQLDLNENEIVNAVERLLIALNQEKYATVYVESFPTTQPPSKTVTINTAPPNLIVNAYGYSMVAAGRAIDFLREQLADMFTFRKAYAAESVGNPGKEIKMISTIEPALAYSFSGFSNEFVVYDVLSRLKYMGNKATFFIMELEIRKYPKIVRQLIENGHEIGIAIRPKEGDTLDQIRKQIISGRQLLQSQYGVKTNLVKQPGGAVSDTTVQAVSELGCVLIGQSITVVQSKHKDYPTADQIMDELFPKSMLALARGQIVHFRMDFYTNKLLVGDLMEVIKRRKIDNVAFSTFYDSPDNNMANDSRYTIKPVGAILNNKKYTYRYPVDMRDVPPALQREGPAAESDKGNLLAKLSKRYIGNVEVNDEDRTLEFSKMESRRLDKSGIIHTNENMIFLTFDDWGTDASINKLLYVLRKHNAPGTFFVITRTVLNNPNLLRTIAVQGHNIGSHSDQHKPMTVRDPKTGRQIKSQDTGPEYVQELTTSYHKLRDVTGDVTFNGKSTLTRLFRAPQLAISKSGLESVFEAGYEFVVAGSFSTRDYAANNVAELVNKIKEGIFTENGKVIKGSVLVMHMSDASPYTAVALDILLTANDAKADTDPSKFIVGRLPDYLIEGYSQSDRKKSLELTKSGSLQ